MLAGVVTRECLRHLNGHNYRPSFASIKQLSEVSLISYSPSCPCKVSSYAQLDFLRISRGMIDDSIIQNLNALMTPSRAKWDPASTAERQISLVDRKPTDPQACQTFKDQVLFQSWQTRSDVLNYCAGVALNPSDPELALKEVETAKERERVVDERLDPYSGRFFPTETRTEVLANTIRNERSVESIVRARTWGLVGERCGSDGTSWEEALNAWRSAREGRR